MYLILRPEGAGTCNESGGSAFLLQTHIMMRYCLLFGVFFLAVLGAGAQLQSYTIGVKGDTLNKVDKDGKKQGKWVVHHDELRGEPGYEEEGEYLDDRKEGVWRKFTLMGDQFAAENYHWGFKDGKSVYFNMNGEVLREESWRAFNPDKLYDTIDVEDVSNPDHYTKVVIKNEGSSIKNGTWKYYDSNTGFISKTENWTLGKLDNSDGSAIATKKSAATAKTDQDAPTKAKPKEVLEFEKKNSGRKKVKVRDGSTF